MSTGAQHARAGRRWWIGGLCCCGLYLALVGTIPFAVRPESLHDDDLFVRQANQLLQGHWLGIPFTPLTLAKGPLHALLMATWMHTGGSVSLALRAFYALAAFLFCTLALPAQREGWRWVALVVLLLDPWMVTLPASRFAREASFIPLSLLALGLAVAALDSLSPPIPTQRWHPQNRETRSSWLLIASSTALGLLLISREARLVILLVEAVLLLLWLLGQWPLRDRQRWLQVALSLAAALLLFLLPLTTLRLWNARVYNAPISNDFEEGQFKRFYEKLVSINLTGLASKPFVPVRHEVLEAIRVAAPSSQLNRLLGALDPHWQVFGCRQNNLMCGEYGGGWLVWALRDAMQLVHPSHDARAFQVFSFQLQQEIGTLCRSHPKTFDCRRRSMGYLPLPWARGEHLPPQLWITTGIHKVHGLLDPLAVGIRPWAVEPIDVRSLPPHWQRLAIQPTTKAQAVESRRILQLTFLLGVLTRSSMALLLLTVLAWRSVARFSRFRQHQAGHRVKSGLRTWSHAYGGNLLLAGYLGIQLLLFTAVEITSFRADRYLVLLSPITTAFLARLLISVHLPRGVRS